MLLDHRCIINIFLLRRATETDWLIDFHRTNSTFFSCIPSFLPSAHALAFLQYLRVPRRGSTRAPPCPGSWCRQCRQSRRWTWSPLGNRRSSSSWSGAAPRSREGCRSFPAKWVLFKRCNNGSRVFLANETEKDKLMERSVLDVVVAYGVNIIGYVW